MWRAFPAFAVTKLILTAFSVLIVSALYFFTNFTIGEDDFYQALGVSSKLVLLFIFVSYLIGKYGWKFLWNSPFMGEMLNKSVCPDLNGTWKGVIASNYNKTDESLTKKEVTAQIEADLFGIKMTLVSDDDYQTSKVVSSSIHKDARTDCFYFSYIYEGSVPQPKMGDDNNFFGAGNLEVKFEQDKMVLDGSYWTNRSWNENKNTAGHIKLIKQG